MIKSNQKTLIKGNYAIAEAALRAGCQCYFGYPITPQSEIGEYLSEKMPEVGLTYINAESEIAAINMVMGAGATGIKAMTSSSSCAIALMQEGISYIAANEIPCVLISVMRGGPGLGYLHPTQGDYTQTVKGGGNGDYKVITFAPSSIQESIDLTYKSFYISQKYRTIVCLLIDGMIGQMMEPAILGKYHYEEIDQSKWALQGAKNRSSRSIKSIEKDSNDATKLVNRLFEKYDLIAKNENMYEEFELEDADLVVISFGSIARIAKSALKQARKKNMKTGLFRPILLNPFPEEKIAEIAKKTKMILVIELNMGQMLQDVKMSIKGNIEIEFYGRPAGTMMSVEEIYSQIESKYNKILEK